MKMVMITYNASFDDEVTNIINKLHITTLTKWNRVLNQAENECTHLDSNIWPGFNFVIITALEEDKIKSLSILINNLRKNIKKEEIKIYIWPLEEII